MYFEAIKSTLIVMTPVFLILFGLFFVKFGLREALISITIMAAALVTGLGFAEWAGLVLLTGGA